MYISESSICLIEILTLLNLLTDWIIVLALTCFNILLLAAGASVCVEHGSSIAYGVCGLDPLYLRTWTGYNWGGRPPFLCDHNYSFSWINATKCGPLTVYIYCAKCDPDYSSRYPDYAVVYGTPVNPGSNVWGGSPLNCTLTSAHPGYYKDFNQKCDHLDYCVLPCNSSQVCPGGDSQPLLCPTGLRVNKSAAIVLGNLSDCT